MLVRLYQSNLRYCLVVPGMGGNKLEAFGKVVASIFIYFFHKFINYSVSNAKYVIVS